jgi:O-antigen ligase
MSTSQKGRISVKTITTTALALIGGFFAGIVLSEIIGIIGYFVFDSLIGFKLLPFVSALAAAGAAVVVANRRRRPGDGWSR